MGWMGTGHKTDEEIERDTPKGASKGPRRVWIPQGETRRYMFLDSVPQTCWEHKFRKDGRWDNWVTCILKNDLPGREDGCPACQARQADDKAPIQWPSLTGFYTVIQMTPWFTDKHQAEMNYRRQVYACLRGTKENPGVLRELERLTQKYGRLEGLVFDIERRAKKDEACGTRFELVEDECVEPKDIEARSLELLEALCGRENKKRDDDKKLTVEKLLKWHPWVPFDFEKDKVIVPKSRDEMLKMFPPRARNRSDDSGGSKGRGDDDSRHDDDEDDDIPY